MKRTKAVKSKRDAFATHCGLSFEETEDYRYHYGHTTQPVWALNDKYYCVTRIGQKPARHKYNMEWNWKKVNDPYVEKDGWQIWKSDTGTE